MSNGILKAAAAECFR